MPISSEARVVVADDVMIREVGGESVILDLKTERYLGLDKVGTRMWAVLTESDSINAAYDALLAEYDVEPDRLKSDLDGFIGKLIEHQLVELSSVGCQPGEPA
jgi:hypothetical protein